MNLKDDCLGPCLEYCSKDYRWTYLILGVLIGVISAILLYQRGE